MNLMAYLAPENQHRSHDVLIAHYWPTNNLDEGRSALHESPSLSTMFLGRGWGCSGKDSIDERPHFMSTDFSV